MPPQANTEKQWRAARTPLPLWYSRFARDNRKRRLAVCACARRVLSLLHNDPLAVALIEACERHADSSAKGAKAAWKAVVAARPPVRKLCDENPSPAAGQFVATRALLWASETAPSEAAVVFDLIQYIFRGRHITPGVTESRAQAAVLRDVFGNPFRPVAFSPQWRTDTAVALAKQMYDSHDYSAMPILADALQDAGCDSDDVLSHCRDARLTHVRGCWVTDLVLGRA